MPDVRGFGYQDRRAGPRKLVESVKCEVMRKCETCGSRPPPADVIVDGGAWHRRCATVTKDGYIAPGSKGRLVALGLGEAGTYPRSAEMRGIAGISGIYAGEDVNDWVAS